MPSVAIHPPKTPVTKGSHTIAKATLPNVCKMPGPPAPFVPAPLPNFAKSELSPKDYSTTVKIEGNTVAIRGATFESIGDMASKGTGGGLISANCHGPAKFITPGSLTVKIEGKSVHLLGEPMLNNCGASGSPPNTGATMTGADHDTLKEGEICDLEIDCTAKDPPYSPCQTAQLCMMIDEFNKIPNDQKNAVSPSPRGTKPYKDQLKSFARNFASLVKANPVDEDAIKKQFYDPGDPNKDCAYKEWVASGRSAKPSGRGPGKFNPDHTHPVSHGGALTGISGMKWADARINVTAGPAMRKYDNTQHKKMTCSKCC